MQPLSAPGPGINTSLPVLLQRRKLPRLFVLTWDNSKTRTRDLRKQEKQEAFGTCYPNGFITLENGTQFTMLSELHHLMELKGTYDIAWLDEIVPDILPGGNAS